MRFTMRFSETRQSFSMGFQEAGQQFDTEFEQFQIVTTAPEVALYDGAYEVTPKVESQKLATAQRYMTQDVAIKAIPYFAVENNSGGNTVYIGKEVN